MKRPLALELREVATLLRNMYVKNRGDKEGEFIACITPSRKDRKTSECWKAWDRLTQVLDEIEHNERFRP